MQWSRIHHSLVKGGTLGRGGEMDGTGWDGKGRVEGRTQMPPHSLGLIISIAPPQLGIILRIRRHAQQIQTVQLVEDF